MAHERLPTADVVVMHTDGPMRTLVRMLVRMLLSGDGYTVTEAPTYTAALRHLRTAPGPVVLVAGNWTSDPH